MKNIFDKNSNLDIKILVLLIVILFLVFVIFAMYVVFIHDDSAKNVSVYIQNQVSIESNTNETIEENEQEIMYIESIPEDQIITQDESVEALKDVTGDTPYYIRVNYTANVVTIYRKNTDGFYTIPYKAMICSCGTATPHSGTYETSSKYRWLSLVGNVNGQYSTRIVNRILFHSVPYLEKTNDSLEYWEYDKLGTTASAGCIRLTVEDAKWIYDNCESGTKVEFYSSEDPGPLGKPVVEKISSNEECRNWDPTDPHKENPWNEY